MPRDETILHLVTHRYLGKLYRSGPSMNGEIQQAVDWSDLGL